MSHALKTIRGIHDGLPAEVAKWRYIEDVAHRIFSTYAISEVRLPILEPTELFVRSVGEETDIVSKEMYAFLDQGADHICLRPEGTAGAVRAYLQAGLTRSGRQRWYYMGPMFRRERPQKGRLRQFQQIGVEWFAADGPIEDIEILTMAHQFLRALGLNDLRMEINSLGCPMCRPAYREILLTFLRERAHTLCELCVDRIDKNPMRVLDCKRESCQAELANAPEMVAHLCAACSGHFNAVTSGLQALNISFQVNARIVRGLDYYNRTAFEITTDQLGAQGTVLAGGRYDGLVEELGGPATSAIGFALGIERLAMLMPAIEPHGCDIAIVTLSDAATDFALKIATSLREQNLSVIHCGTGSAKRQFKIADREKARFACIMGDDELASNIVTLKNMQTGEQQHVSLDKIKSVISA
ncbi:MAG: histidine--tRNA ligase [Mariprofundaceae bacterium]